MKMFLRWLGFLTRKKKEPYTLITAQEEVERIKTMMKPSSLTPINEVLLTLYNFHQESPFRFVEDFYTLRGESIKTHCNTSLGLAQLLSEAFNYPFRRVMAQYEIDLSGKTERPVMSWYSNIGSIELINHDMMEWCQLGMRAHFERSGEGDPGNYDQPITQNQKDFVFSSVFVKVLNDYVELMDLTLRTQPRGTDLEQTNQPQR